MMKIKLDGNFSKVTNELGEMGYKKAKHSDIAFISKSDKQMLVIENCQGDYTIETFIMTGKANSNSKNVSLKFEEDYGYFNVPKSDTYLWKECVVVEDTNSGHIKFLCRGAL